MAFSVDETQMVWRDSTASIPADRLAEVAARHAGESAIVEADGDRGRQVSYAEFDDLVTRVALGVTARTAPGDRVGILTDDTIDHLSALFGVQRAGRIAVPLDAANPLPRLQHIVDHSGLVSILVTSESAAEGLVVSEESMVELGEMHQGEQDPSLEGPKPESPAQIMYTSGSTGVPKGVVQSHR